MKSNPFSTIESALEDFRNGKMIIVCDDEERENEGDLVIAADAISPEAINFMATEGRGLICLAINQEIAHRLNLEKPQSINHHTSHCNFTHSIDALEGVTTGTSAHDRAATVKKAIHPMSTGVDFSSPGHIFPVLAKEGGVLVRAGHTEAATDLALLADMTPAGVICEIMNEDGTMARLPNIELFAKKHDIKIITIADLIEYRTQKECLVKRVASAPIPTEYGQFMMHVYKNQINDSEDVALVFGDIDAQKSVLTRVHSACLTGDVFGSKRCDCGPQLDKAMKMISEHGAGVIVYMQQEGRGIGLINKIKAYDLQDKGYDTVEANNMLGFKADLRTYGIGAQILRDLGIHNISLLTNNPRKVVGLEGYGLKITESVALQTPPKPENRQYLQTKKDKLGHTFTNL